MKWIASFLIVSIMISCHEDESPDNYVSAKRNNLDWVGSSEMALDRVTDTLTFLGIANRPNDEVIVMKIKFDGTGSYSLTKNQGYYYSTVGGDVLSSEYQLGPSSVGDFVISKYNQLSGYIEGRFDMSLKKERANPENNIDIYNFTQGSFKGKVNK